MYFCNVIHDSQSYEFVFPNIFFTKTDTIPMAATILCPKCSYIPATSTLLVRHFHRTTS